MPGGELPPSRVAAAVATGAIRTRHADAPLATLPMLARYILVGCVRISTDGQDLSAAPGTVESGCCLRPRKGRAPASTCTSPPGTPSSGRRAVGVSARGDTCTTSSVCTAAAAAEI